MCNGKVFYSGRQVSYPAVWDSNNGPALRLWLTCIARPVDMEDEIWDATLFELDEAGKEVEILDWITGYWGKEQDLLDHCEAQFDIYVDEEARRCEDTPK